MSSSVNFENRPGATNKQGAFARYLSAIICSILVPLVALTYLGLHGRDHFAAIEGAHGKSWYKDLGGAFVTEIQDQDLFYHGIGASIENVKKADVIIVGSSLVAFAIDGKIARSVLAQHADLSFYNMSFVGISSGEFTRRIITKYNIRPRLWIINADDGGGNGNFFALGVQRSFSADVKTIAATEHGDLVAYEDVARRNLRWRAEALFESAFGSFATGKGPDRAIIPEFFRDASTGDYDMKSFPRYNANNNPPVAIEPRADCHATEEVIQTAKKFVRDIGERVVLSLIPNTYYCEQQAQEVAQAIGAELVLTDRVDYSSWDGGGHLDRQGSASFTADLMGALMKSRTYHQIYQESSKGRLEFRSRPPS